MFYNFIKKTQVHRFFGQGQQQQMRYLSEMLTLSDQVMHLGFWPGCENKSCLVCPEDQENSLGSFVGWSKVVSR